MWFPKVHYMNSEFQKLFRNEYQVRRKRSKRLKARSYVSKHTSNEA